MFQLIDFGNNCKEGIKKTKYVIQYGFTKNNCVLGMEVVIGHNILKMLI